jgi:hypothetical protein
MQQMADESEKKTILKSIVIISTSNLPLIYSYELNHDFTEYARYYEAA